MNFQDSKYTTTAPYLILNYESGAFTGDVSVRQDANKASGSYFQTLPGFGGTTAGAAYNLAAPRTIDYSFEKTSFSVGGNYALSRDLAVFGRVSEGAAYNADRITFFNAPGLVNGTSPEIPVNKVRQIEGGVKLRQGSMSLFATVFAAKTDEINVDVTTNPIRSTATTYDSKGLELEGAARFGMFSVLAGATFTDAKVTASSNAALVGKAPKRQAKLVYQLTPTVQFNDAITAGVSIVGTTGSMDDSPAGPVTVVLPAYTVVNLFASYAINDRFTVGLAANNLFDTLAYTESNDGRGAARAHTGRTVKASLKYAF
jgi:outer membrane receptor protein involved in Fe transport